MLLIKISNTQNLNLKLNHGFHLDWPILLKSKINFTKVSARKKIHSKKKIMKNNYQIQKSDIIRKLEIIRFCRNAVE